MKAWKYLNTPIPQLIGRGETAETADQANERVMASIQAKSAEYVADLTYDELIDTTGIVVVEGEPSDIEMHGNAFVTKAIEDAWRYKDTFVQFADDVLFDRFQFPGSIPAELTSGQIDEIEFLKAMCTKHLSKTVDKTNVWSRVSDSKQFNKMDV